MKMAAATWYLFVHDADNNEAGMDDTINSAADVVETSCIITNTKNN